MKFAIKPISAEEFGFPYFGQADFKATFIAGLNDADGTCISFFRGSNIEKLSKIKTGILFVEEKLEGKIEQCQSKALVFCDNPKFHWINTIAKNYSNSFEEKPKPNKIHSEAKISEFAFIESNVIVGKNSSIYPHVCIFKDTFIGDNCEIQSGSVIGGIGLGDVWYGGTYHKFVHLGNVKIGNNVSIGTNVSILKGMTEQTLIGEGTKIGNNVNIGHNVTIGKNCYISSGVTIGGACIIEDNCWIAVGATLNDHVHMEKNSKAGTGSVIIKDTLENGFYLGNPARKISERVD